MNVHVFRTNNSKPTFNEGKTSPFPLVNRAIFGWLVVFLIFSFCLNICSNLWSRKYSADTTVGESHEETRHIVYLFGYLCYRVWDKDTVKFAEDAVFIRWFYVCFMEMLTLFFETISFEDIVKM